MVIIPKMHLLRFFPTANARIKRTPAPATLVRLAVAKDRKESKQTSASGFGLLGVKKKNTGVKLVKVPAGLGVPMIAGTSKCLFHDQIQKNTHRHAPLHVFFLLLNFPYAFPCVDSRQQMNSTAHVLSKERKKQEITARKIL